MTLAPPLPGAGAIRPPRPRLSRDQENRRSIVRGGALALGLLLLQPLAWLPVVRRVVDRLRPPGALPEEEFLAACIKCGQCVQVCPVYAIELADVGDGFGLGTPHITPRKQACDFSCDALSCVLACPTGALSHALKTKEDVRAGVARLARPDACLARRGEAFHGFARGAEFRGRLRYEEIDRWRPQRVAEHRYDVEPCDLCARECPLGARALRMVSMPGVPGRFSPEVLAGCVGCGVCEMICPAEPSCFVVEARATWSPEATGSG